MSDELWIVVPNWHKFQHYKDRRPPWIKLYTELRDRDDWLGLSMTERGLLVSIWLEYAAANGELRCTRVAGMVHSQVHRNVRRRALLSLSDAGFIQLSASKPLEIRARARSTETEKETSLPSFGEKPKTRENPRRSENRNDGQRSNVQASDPVAAIRQMIQNGVIRDLVDLEAELAGYELDSHLADELRSLLAPVDVQAGELAELLAGLEEGG